MRKILCFLFLLTAFTAQAGPDMYPISVKDRLRILLWTEGLADSKIEKPYVPKKNSYPEELDRALRKNIF